MALTRAVLRHILCLYKKLVKNGVHKTANIEEKAQSSKTLIMCSEAISGNNVFHILKFVGRI